MSRRSSKIHNEDGEVNHHRQDKAKHKKHLKRSPSVKLPCFIYLKHSKHYRDRKDKKKRSRSRSHKTNRVKSNKEREEQLQIEEENKKIDLILELQDEEHQQKKYNNIQINKSQLFLEDKQWKKEDKKQNWEDVLGKYRDLDGPKLDMSEQEEQEHIELRVQASGVVDESKQHYLKMLEALRDQETTGGVQQSEEAMEPKKHKVRDMMNMFGSSSEESDEVKIRRSESPQVGIVPIEADDDNKYYRATVGEILNKQYRVTHAKSGKGVFSNVVKAVCIESGQEVAIKLLRSEEIYLRSGERERSILEVLNANDKGNKKHIVQLQNHFEHRKHLCLVFESLEMNLREYIRTYGKGNGLSLDLVRKQATQLFIALSHLRKHKIIHADIKPDNILVSIDGITLKLCDFGTAFPVEETSLVEYLVSRYYRAPEVIVGYPYETQIDMWSAGCTLFEAFTGNFLFSGANNNEMLRLQIQTMGKFSQKILKRAAFVTKYFDSNYTFLSKEVDPTTNQEYIKPLLLGERATRDVMYMLKKEKESSFKVEEQKQLFQFKDLLEKCLQLDPKNRITPDEALQHPFINQTIYQNRK